MHLMCYIRCSGMYFIHSSTIYILQSSTKVCAYTVPTSTSAGASQCCLHGLLIIWKTSISMGYSPIVVQFSHVPLRTWVNCPESLLLLGTTSDTSIISFVLITIAFTPIV